ARGKGCHVWDVDGNEYIEYGMGLRSVALGHAFPRVVDAVRKELANGTNFTRPSPLEVEAAEIFLQCVPTAEMVKFAKNGSDATTAAVKLARAHTGRELVAICGDQPFFSTDDWFIGSTAMPGGIPGAIRDLTVKFRYNDAASLEDAFRAHPDRIACVILEAETSVAPQPGFLAALAGKREIMELGGIRHPLERVFLLSTTHGAETHSLAAGIASMGVYQDEPVIETLYRQGERLQRGVDEVTRRHGIQDYLFALGRPCNLVFATR